jgi:hypothetical protein
VIVRGRIGEGGGRGSKGLGERWSKTKGRRERKIRRERKTYDSI